MGLLDEVEEGNPDIFEDESALRHNTAPEDIIRREEEKKAIASELINARYGEKPDNVFVFGPNGVGKTAVTTFVLREFEEDDKTDIPIQTLRINCETVNRSYHLGAKLSNELLGFNRYNIDNPGVQKDAPWETAFNAIEEHGGVTLLCLDEIGSIKDKDDALYKMSRAYNYLDDAILGLVCISTDASVLDTIGEDTSSSLSEVKVSFSRYDGNELHELLEHLADKAFHDGTVSDGATAKAAALGAQAGGDAREALDLLRGAGRIAMRQQDEMVREEHVDIKKDEMDKNEVFEILTEKLKPNHRYSACALLAAQIELDIEYDESEGTRDSKYPRTSEVYTVYQEIVSDPIGNRQFRSHLDTFDEVNLTDRIPNSPQGGGDNHELKFETKDVYIALEDFIRDNIPNVSDQSSPLYYLTDPYRIPGYNPDEN